MGFLKKTILLSNQGNYDKGMAILTIEKNNSGVFGNIKIFDVPKLNNLVLGISVNGNPITKQNLIFNNGNVYNFKLDNDFNIDGKIGCVLVNICDEKVDVLIWGTNGNISGYKKDIVNNLEKEIRPIQNSIKIHNVADFQLNNDEIIKTNNDTDVNQLFESDDEEVEQIINDELKEENTFFGIISDQINELFDRFPEDKQLADIIEDSKWVKVDYNGDGKEYVIGLIYDKNDVRYICYGVPSSIDMTPPEELMPYSQWLRINDDRGYWLMYQDALTGDNVLIDGA